MTTDIKIFENKKNRSYYDKDAEKWYFSVVDVVAILIDKDY